MGKSLHPTKLRLLACAISFIFVEYYNQCYSIQRQYNLKKSALQRRKKKRVTWSQVRERISDRHFRRMFRMSHHCFQLLCQKIIAHVGESNFKSEEYIDAFLHNPYNPSFTRQTCIHYAHCHTTGGYISGEVKLAITLRLLAGGDALDLAVIFDVSD